MVALLAVATVTLAAIVSGVVVFVLGTGGTGRSTRRYYVAIGASQALGYQPTASGGSQRPTYRGYAHDLRVAERARWPGLRLVRFACPGIRVELALSGGGRCPRPHGSEVATATAFLRKHPGQVVLVTVDLGYPDVAACLAGQAVDPTCVTHALVQVRTALRTVLSRLRSAGGSSPTIVGLGHDDPFLGDYVGTADPNAAFAAASTVVVARLNRVLSATYTAAGARVARVGAAFATATTTPAHLSPWGTVPLDVKRICTLTWTCADHNPHPNARGYRKIAAAVAASVPG